MAAENVRADISGLPENCIANVLSLTTPKDACRLSLVASKFHSAAHFDGVWERFVPRDLVSRAANTRDLLAFTSKKDLYFHLCDHDTIIDDGTKSFALEEGSGKISYMFSARSLEIAWGNDTRYWRWFSFDKSQFNIHLSRFSEAADLCNACWLEIRLKISTKMLSPGTNYAAYLVFILISNLSQQQPVDASYELQPVDASVRIGEQEGATRSVYLCSRGILTTPSFIVSKDQLGVRYGQLCFRPGEHYEAGGCEYPKIRDDTWMEVELGEIFIRGGVEEDEWVDISLKEVTGGLWKDILVLGIEIRPN
ncbi:PREDICTED: F-box protein PP2-B10-like [Ipomoea nil]|uniref:F-box protein PP2-B10-like n=1 Tax=Ipomoea nil TaxID=35883 RepID=UPI00090193A1|nr:PREDICTED: F-box protein PP2-B10-like [Ipomoea nil]